MKNQKKQFSPAAEEIAKYQFLVNSWSSSKLLRKQTLDSEDMIDNLNKKVCKIHRQLKKTINLENFTNIEGQLVNKDNIKRPLGYEELNKKIFLLQDNRKSQQKVINEQKVGITKLQAENRKLKQQLLGKQRQIKELSKEIKQIEQKKCATDLKLQHHQTSTSESDFWPQQLYKGHQFSILLQSPHLIEKQSIKINRNLKEVEDFLNKSLKKDSSLVTLMENKNQFSQIIMGENRRNHLVESPKGVQCGQDKMSTCTQVAFHKESKKRFFRSPVLNRVQMLKRRLVDRY